MRNCFLLTLLLLILGCNNSTNKPEVDKNTTSANKNTASVTANEEADKSKLYTLEPATKADFEQAASRQTISFSMNPNEARKANGVLVLKIKNNWTPLEAFRDTLLNTDDPDIREYRYLGQNQALNQYLVAGSFYEGFETYLVDKTTGRITSTWTEPIISPDQKYLANVSLVTTMDGPPNGIQIWKVAGPENSPTIEKYLELNPDWKPFELHWESPRSIIIKVIPIEKYKQLQATPKEEDFSYLRLKLK